MLPESPLAKESSPPPARSSTVTAALEAPDVLQEMVEPQVVEPPGIVQGLGEAVMDPVAAAAARESPGPLSPTKEK